VTLANPQIGFLNVANPQTKSADSSHGQHPKQHNFAGGDIDDVKRDDQFGTAAHGECNDIVGLRFEFDLRKSIAVDGTGQITGAVTPNLNLKAITPSDADAFIDDFVAGVVSVNAGGNSFVIQGPHGHQSP